LGDFKKFLEQPGDEVHVFQEGLVCERDRVLIAYSLKDQVESLIKGGGFTNRLLDFTFQTNREGLLLGAIGRTVKALWRIPQLQH